VELVCRGKPLVPGEAEGALLAAPLGLSFWGGVDPRSGRVVDGHHPLHGQCIAGCVLAIPGGRGSCSGSGVLLELILAGRAPAAIVVREREEILTLGALVAEMIFGRSIAVLQIGPEETGEPVGAEEDTNARVRRVVQTLADPEGHRDWVIEGVVDCDATDEAGELVLATSAMRRLG